MDRAIVGYHVDDEGQWVAELSCGHARHVRHRPPFEVREWTSTDAGRASHLGTPIECARCDEADTSVGAPCEGGEAPCLLDRVCDACGRVLETPHEHGPSRA